MSVSSDRERAGSATDQLRQHGEVVRDDLRELGRLTKDAAQQKLAEVRDTAAEYYDEGVQKANELGKGMEKYVQQHPLKSVLIAAGAGIVVGMLLSRR